MGGYKVRVLQTRGIRQRFHVRIESDYAPFEALFWSENYANAAYARSLAERLAEQLDATLVDETKEK